MVGKRRRLFAFKWICYAVVLLFIYVLQTAYGIAPTLFGVRINLLPFFVASAAVLEEPMQAAMAGALAGVLADAAGIGPDGLFLLYYTFCGGACAMLAHRFFRKMAPVSLILGAAVMLVQGLPVCLFYYVLIAGIPLADGLFILGKELFFSAAFALLVYYILMLVHRGFTLKEE